MMPLIFCAFAMLVQVRGQMTDPCGNLCTMPKMCDYQTATCKCPMGQREVFGSCQIDPCSSGGYGGGCGGSPNVCVPSNTNSMDFSCICADGYSLSIDGRTCNPGPCKANPCPSGTTGCTEVGNTRICQCADGNVYIDGYGCVANLCQPSPCTGTNAVCVQNSGYNTHCDCPDNYYVLDWSDWSNPSCQQYDACHLGNGEPSPCGTHSTACTVVSGGYTCTCADGYRFSAGTCVQITPCDSVQCGAHETCVVVGTAAQCNCVNKWTKNNNNTCVPSICYPVNPCGDYSTCGYQIDGFSTACGCITGYQWSAGKPGCIPDPCKAAVNPCGTGGTCSNYGDGYKCTCKSGYLLNIDQSTCIKDVCNPNPCGGTGNTCSKMSDTTYTCMCFGSYIAVDNFQRCVLPSQLCDSNPCGAGNTCTVMGSSYTCACAAGQKMVSVGGWQKCITDPCIPNPCVGGWCNFDQSSQSAACSCPSNWYLDTMDRHTCRQDFCAGNPCGNGNMCYNNAADSTYSCQCADGWNSASDGKSCIKVPGPCDNTPTPCGDGNTCTSYGGSSYMCQCNAEAGWLSVNMGQKCVQDSCRSQPCGESGTCVFNYMTYGYSCACPAGSRAFNNSHGCVPDPCDPTPCGGPNTCNFDDSTGGHTCACSTGWSSSDNGRSCTQGPNCPAMEADLVTQKHTFDRTCKPEAMKQYLLSQGCQPNTDCSWWNCGKLDPAQLEASCQL